MQRTSWLVIRVLGTLLAASLLACGAEEEEEWRVNGDFPGDGLQADPTWQGTPPGSREAQPPSILQGGPGGPQAPSLGQPPAPGAAPPAEQPGKPTPGKLPTWVPLDWGAFPVDRGPAYPARRTWDVSVAGSDQGAGTAGSPLRTISAALDRAMPGDVVRVHSGTYAEGAPGRSYALRMERDRVVLTAAPGASVTLVPASSAPRFGIYLRGSHLVVNGIRVQGFRPAIHFGRSDVTQRDIVLSNLTLQGGGGGFSDGIASYATGQGKPVIDGLLLKKVSISGHALSFSCGRGPCRSLRFEDLKVIGDGGGAGSSGSDAVAVEAGDNVLFLRAEISGAAADGIDMKATRVVVWDSHVHHVSRNGVKLWWGGDVVNTCIHNTGADAALVVKAGERVRLLHTTVANVSLSSNAYAMTFRYDDNGPIQVEIINSIVANTGGPVYVSKAAKLSVHNSLLFNSKNGRLIVHGPLEVTAATGAAMLGGGNLIANPGLDANLRPLPASIAIDRGRVWAPLYPAEDLTGLPRIKGAAPDVGPFEVR